MKDSIVLSETETKIMRFLDSEFLARVKAHNDNPKAFKTDRYYRWVSTARIARGIDLPIHKTRRICYEMVLGHLELKKMSGVCVWSTIDPPKGFKRHQFKDYFEPIVNTAI